MTIINSEADYERAVARVTELWHVAPGTPEADELDALAAAIEAYESLELDRELPPAQPGPLIAYKLRELNMSQNQLARKAGIPSGRMSEIIQGRRGLTLEHVRRIASALQLDPALLIDDRPNPPVVRVAVDAGLAHAARAQGWLGFPSLDAMVNAAVSTHLLGGAAAVGATMTVAETCVMSSLQRRAA